MPKIDPKLYEFATVRQLELLEAIDKHGSYRRAATALGITKGTLDTPPSPVCGARPRWRALRDMVAPCADGGGAFLGAALHSGEPIERHASYGTYLVAHLRARLPLFCCGLLCHQGGE